MAPPWQARTVHGYLLAELVSALQKDIRRANADGACFWAYEATISGYGAAIWRRLMVIASEDLGVADPMAAVHVSALYQNSVALVAAQKAGGDKTWPPLQLVQACWLLAHGRKNRELNAMIDVLTLRMQRGDLPVMPDYALDQFTPRGRAMGRGEVHFNAESTRLEGDVVEVEGNLWHRRFLEEWHPDLGHPSRKGIGGPLDPPTGG